MEPIQPGSSRVDMQAFQGLVVEYLQDMRVARDKEFGRVDIDLGRYLAGIFAGIAPYVSHPHIHPLDGKPLMLWVAQAQSVPVDITIYGPKGF